MHHLLGGFATSASRALTWPCHTALPHYRGAEECGVPLSPPHQVFVSQHLCSAFLSGSFILRQAFINNKMARKSLPYRPSISLDQHLKGKDSKCLLYTHITKVHCSLSFDWLGCYAYSWTMARGMECQLSAWGQEIGSVFLDSIVRQGPLPT